MPTGDWDSYFPSSRLKQIYKQIYLDQQTVIKYKNVFCPEYITPGLSKFKTKSNLCCTINPTVIIHELGVETADRIYICEDHYKELPERTRQVFWNLGTDKIDK